MNPTPVFYAKMKKDIELETFRLEWPPFPNALLIGFNEYGPILALEHGEILIVKIDHVRLIPFKIGQQSNIVTPGNMPRKGGLIN